MITFIILVKTEHNNYLQKIVSYINFIDNYCFLFSKAFDTAFTTIITFMLKYENFALFYSYRIYSLHFTPVKTLIFCTDYLLNYISL